MTDNWGICFDIALRWMSLGLTDDVSTLVQVMAWWRQVTSHYLSQCWPRSMSPYGVTRPQYVKSYSFGVAWQNVKTPNGRGYFDEILSINLNDIYKAETSCKLSIAKKIWAEHFHLFSRPLVSKSGPVFFLLFGVSSGCARSITGHVTSVTWSVIGLAKS